jgi:hypothetical protein
MTQKHPYEKELVEKLGITWGEASVCLTEAKESLGMEVNDDSRKEELIAKATEIWHAKPKTEKKHPTAKETNKKARDDATSAVDDGVGMFNACCATCWNCCRAPGGME